RRPIRRALTRKQVKRLPGRVASLQVIGVSPGWAERPRSWNGPASCGTHPSRACHEMGEKGMTQTQMIPETFLGVGYAKDRAGLPREAVRIPAPQPVGDQVLIRVAASSLNPLEYKLADLNFLGRTPPVILGLDLSGIIVAIGNAVHGVAVGDAVVAMADLNGDGGWVAGGGGEGSYALAREFLTVPKPESLRFLYAAALPMCFLSAFV